MSSSMCWAESLKPIGMPPESSRTSSAKVAESASVVQSGNATGRSRRDPPAGRADRGDLADDLVARQVTAGAGLGALAALEVKRLDRAACPRKSRSAPRPARRSSGVRGLLLGQHAALARADAGAGQLGAAGQRRFSPAPTASRSSCPRRTAGSPAAAASARPARSPPRCRPAASSSSGGVASCAVMIWMSSHVGSSLPRHAHGRDRAVMAGLAQALGGVVLDQLDVRLVRIAVHVGVEALVDVAPVGLRMLASPRPRPRPGRPAARRPRSSSETSAAPHDCCTR